MLRVPEPGVDAVQDAAQPIGARPDDATLAEGLDQDFLRIDLELYAVFEPKWGGRRTTIRPYLRILNALDRRDALFYSFEPWRGDALRPLAERTLLPLLGLAFTF